MHEETKWFRHFSCFLIIKHFATPNLNMTTVMDSTCPPTEITASDNLRSNVWMCEAFGLQNEKLRSKDVVICRICEVSMKQHLTMSNLRAHLLTFNTEENAEPQWAVAVYRSANARLTSHRDTNHILTPQLKAKCLLLAILDYSLVGKIYKKHRIIKALAIKYKT